MQKELLALVAVVVIASLLAPKVDATSPTGRQQRQVPGHAPPGRRPVNTPQQGSDHPDDIIVFPGYSGTITTLNREFGYGPQNGPHTWAEKFPTCGGNLQSPINIDLNVAKHSPPSMEDVLSFKNYDVEPLQLTVMNSGHSLRMTGNWSNERTPRVSGFVLPGEYRLAEVHFHWGAHDGEGSEHVFQGKRFPMEMHVVNYKTTYGSYSEAISKKDGLVVISYLFQIQHKINPALQKLVVASKGLPYPESQRISIAPFTLDKLAPLFTRKYVSYLGSLTTPPCSETVRWIINLDLQPVSSEQLENLRKLMRGDGTIILFNYRPVQSLNGRDIVNVP